MFIPDALDMFAHRDRQLAHNERRLPLCDCCAEFIQDEDYYDIEGYILCPGCLETCFKRWTEDYME